MPPRGLARPGRAAGRVLDDEALLPHDLVPVLAELVGDLVRRRAGEDLRLPDPRVERGGTATRSPRRFLPAIRAVRFPPARVPECLLVGRHRARPCGRGARSSVVWVGPPTTSRSAFPVDPVNLRDRDHGDLRVLAQAARHRSAISLVFPKSDSYTTTAFTMPPLVGGWSHRSSPSRPPHRGHDRLTVRAFRAGGRDRRSWIAPKEGGSTGGTAARWDDGRIPDRGARVATRPVPRSAGITAGDATCGYGKPSLCGAARARQNADDVRRGGCDGGPTPLATPPGVRIRELRGWPGPAPDRERTSACRTWERRTSSSCGRWARCGGRRGPHLRQPR